MTLLHRLYELIKLEVKLRRSSALCGERRATLPSLFLEVQIKKRGNNKTQECSPAILCELKASSLHERHRPFSRWFDTDTESFKKRNFFGLSPNYPKHFANTQWKNIPPFSLSPTQPLIFWQIKEKKKQQRWWWNGSQLCVYFHCFPAAALLPRGLSGGCSSLPPSHHSQKQAGIDSHRHIQSPSGQQWLLLRHPFTDSERLRQGVTVCVWVRMWVADLRQPTGH